MCGGILLAAAASHVLPPGEYDRRDDPATGRRVVVAGTYHAVAARPVGIFQTLVAIPRGMADAAAVIFFVFLIGGAFTVVDETGALRQGVDWLVRRFGHSAALVVPSASLAFALGGVLDNMKEEIIALVPVMLLLARRLGYRPVVAVAMSLGAAAVGAAFSPINPFQVGIAQQLAQLPLLSGSRYRIAFLAAALGVWIWGTSRYAARTQSAPTSEPEPTAGTLDGRRGAVLTLVLVTFVALVVGVLRFGWGFNEMAALFFAMGVVAGLVGGLGVGGTADALVAGFRSMAYAALLIGFARAIFVTLEQGRIVDTIVHGLFTPVAQLPVALAALGMMLVHGLVHIPVPSPSGHAVLTLPILVPLADLLGLSRQVTVLAYQYGGGLCELLTPTNGALMAILAAAEVRYEDWLRFALPVLLGLYALAAAAVGLGVAIALQ
ncbi:MAG: YfcC family protein [Gemmatimonadetes bacterium]|nr:MAG: YfcC family protein [Gemmatimonadota bacterium]